MKIFDIWSEGYGGSDGWSKAIKLDSIEADSFDEAVEKYIEKHSHISSLKPHKAERKQFTTDEAFKNRRTNWYYWGCALFDNEEDARKTFG